ncbi:MAG: alkaline phosphatase D family protein [Acidimicrobiales bacterium]
METVEGDAGFTTAPLVLGPMLRYVSTTSATVWVETSRPGTVEVLGHRASTFSVRGRHFALVIIEGLEPASVIPYEVRFDDDLVWPQPDSELPPSVIRTLGHGDVDLLIGSCRAAAPHEKPYTLELAFDDRGRGIDTMRAHAKRMVYDPPEKWPVAMLLVGDQIYADDSSPSTKERIEATRPDADELPPSLVADFDEYCWLYHEAWSPTFERWLFSVVPTLMIFDDHDVIDDWNISASWVTEMSGESWWEAHAVGSVMSYWIYQHLGNQSPEQIRADGLLDRLVEANEASQLLESWARSVNDDPTTYQFSFSRHIGEVKVVVVDGRHARVLDGSTRPDGERG